jgi:uncharacterized protein (TIGR03437 family)
MMQRMRIALLMLAAEVASAQATGVWEARARYPLEATEVSGAAIDGRVYVMCGLTAQGSTNRLFRYDPRSDSWTELARVPIDGGADHCNVAAAAGKLYVLGAIRIGSGFIDGTTWEYDPAQDRWQRVGDMNTPRGASGVAAIGSNIYVAGGLSARGSVADFEVFDTVSRRWTRLPDMPTARDHLTAQAIGGRMYAIAGRAAREFTANEEYDPGTNRWRARAPIPTARGGLGSAVVDNKIVVFGGEGNSGTPEGTFRQNEEYDPVADTWRTLTPMPTARHGLYGIAIGRAIFVPAGGPRAGAFYTSTHEAYFARPAEPPRINAHGLVNAAGGPALIAPGSIVSIYGAGLAPLEQTAARFPLPAQVGSVSVRVNGMAVPLFYVGPEQINFLLPLDIGTVASVAIDYAGSTAQAAPDAQAETAPGIFAVSPARSVRHGEVIEIYGTGLGPVTNPPLPGSAALAVPLSETAGETIVTIGGTRASVLYSGLAPGLAGVYQINARVPDGARVGERIPVTIQIGEQGLPSQPAPIAIE